MSESKHEIPAPILDAATTAVKAYRRALEFSDDFNDESAAEAALEAAGAAKMAARIRELEADAERYRWLREQDWDTGPLAVVRDPKLAVKWGHDLPSRARLDEAIDAAMNSSSGAGGE